MYLLAINCGSSSIKGKLYSIPSDTGHALETAAELGVSNISAKGQKVKIKLKWNGGSGNDDTEEDGDDGDSVDCTPYMYTLDQSRADDNEYPDKAMVPLLLDKMTSTGQIEKSDIRYVAHRVSVPRIARTNGSDGPHLEFMVEPTKRGSG